ncbi:MAG: hypothetical protein CV089_08415 [Nitrospira sp. WS110]|nr:hypothetical protein [Nitrospira sp. WS110]
MEASPEGPSYIFPFVRNQQYRQTAAGSWLPAEATGFYNTPGVLAMSLRSLMLIQETDIIEPLS